MKQKWMLLKNRFETLAARERLLVVGAIVAAVYLLWDLLLLQPIAKQKELFVARERVAQAALTASQAEVQVLSGLVRVDPNMELRREIQDLQNKLAQLDRELDKAEIGLVPAEALPKVMHGVLSKIGKLKIVNMVTLPPEQLSLSSNLQNAVAEQGPAEEEAGVKIFKHSVVLNLAGDFPSVVEYLKTLEQSDWRFYWDSLRYEVKNYPNADVRLRVFTLSTQRGVLDGV